ncbi:MAG TPA: uracil-DNA glycosylase family protein [Chloroflexota bacterium]|nr:uracil-DNA glycosylase family protein [Chloroflexota bacterium]
MERLASEVVACRACAAAGYLAHANPIRPTLIANPRVMLIGQAPGPVTDRKGYHFAGPAGRFLDIWLDRAGFPPGYFRAHVYLTSLTRCFPGKSPSGNGDRPPSRAEIALCRPFLEREFQLIQPSVVLLVGKMAIEAFLGRHPLVETVGHVFRMRERASAVRRQPGEGTPVFVPLPHASGVSRWLNEPAHRARLDQALAELGRLRAELGL